MEFAKIEQQKKSMIIRLPQCDKTLQPFLNKGSIWGIRGSQDSLDSEIPVKIVSENQVYGWDSAHVLSVSRLNRIIQEENVSPNTFSVSLEDKEPHLTAKGEFGCWKIAPGSAGRNLNLILPIRACTLQQEFSDSTDRFTNLTASIQVDLWQAASGKTNASNEASRLRPMVSVLHVTGNSMLKMRHKMLFKLILSHWCQSHMDEILSLFDSVGTLSAGYKSFACMDTQDPDTDKIGILSAAEPERLDCLQRILPLTQSDAILINQNSDLCQNILRELPVFQRFPVSVLSHQEEGIRAEGVLLPQSKAVNDLAISIKACNITFQPQLRVELDICVTLPSGIVVHLVINPSFNTTYSATGIRSHFDDTSSLHHYAEIPAGVELSEAQQKEIIAAAEKLADSVLL
ncbi:TULIP family P47-like protein [Oscillospiraceae bacterium PP1C4]